MQARAAKAKQLWIIVEWDNGAWHAYVPSVRGVRAHGRTIGSARRNVRQQLARTQGPAAAKSPVQLMTEIRLLEAPARRAVERAQEARQAAAEAEALATAREVEAAKLLYKRGMATPDIGEIFQTTQKRVGRLLTAK